MCKWYYKRYAKIAVWLRYKGILMSLYCHLIYVLAPFNKNKSSLADYFLPEGDQ